MSSNQAGITSTNSVKNEIVQKKINEITLIEKYRLKVKASAESFRGGNKNRASTNH